MTIADLMWYFIDTDYQYLRVFGLLSNSYLFEGTYEQLCDTPINIDFPTLHFNLANAEVSSIDNIWQDSENVSERTLTINVEL